jgi:cell division protein FtsQ
VWDNPRLLNLTANALISLAVLLFAAAALQSLLHSSLFPLREVVVKGALDNISREEVSSALDGIGGNFFSADLAAVRGRLEQVGWVRKVDARRVWPDRIEVRLEEHMAFARWGEVEGDLQARGLVNSHGEPFSAALDADEQARLPLFAGPVGTEGEIARRYRRFTELLAPLGMAPEHGALVSIVLTPRHAWRLRTAGGLELELGRDGAEPVEARLARFVAAYPESIGRLARSTAGSEPRRHVDLRYPNGFALRVAGWKS